MEEDNVSLEEVITPPPSEVSEIDFQERLGQIRTFEQIAYKKSEAWINAIPDWIPIVSPLLQYVKSECASSLVAQGVNPETGEEFPDTKTKLEAYLKIKLESLLHEAEAAFDTAAIVGTAGAGAPEDIAVKELLKHVGKEWLSQTATKAGENYLASLSNKINIAELLETTKIIGDKNNPQAVNQFLNTMVTSTRNIGNVIGDSNPAVAEAAHFLSDTMNTLFTHPVIGETIANNIRQSPTWESIQGKATNLSQFISSASSQG